MPMTLRHQLTVLQRQLRDQRPRLRSDREPPELVEGEDPVRELGGDLLYAGEFGVSVRSLVSFQVLVLWKVIS